MTTVPPTGTSETLWESDFTSMMLSFFFYKHGRFGLGDF